MKLRAACLAFSLALLGCDEENSIPTNIEVIEQRFCTEADPNIVRAADRGDMACLKRGLQLGAPIDFVDPDLNETALTMATWRGNEPMIQFLIEKGASLEQPGLNGTPLVVAAYIGSMSVFDILFGAGANINYVGPIHTVFFASLLGGHPDNAQDILELGATQINPSQFEDASLLSLLVVSAKSSEQTGKYVILENWIEEMITDSPIDVTRADASGRAPIHYAAQSNSQPVIELLISHGANINRRVGGSGEFAGKTALIIGADFATENVETLLAVGANPRLFDNDGFTAMDYASYLAGDPYLGINSDLELLHKRNEVKMQLQGQGPMENFEASQALLDEAAANSLTQNRIVTLGRNGANFDAVDESGKTAIHHLTLHENTELVSYLLKQNAHPNKIDSEGKTPKDHAPLGTATYDEIHSFGGQLATDIPTPAMPLDLDQRLYLNGEDTEFYAYFTNPLTFKIEDVISNYDAIPFMTDVEVLYVNGEVRGARKTFHIDVHPHLELGWAKVVDSAANYCIVRLNIEPHPGREYIVSYPEFVPSTGSSSWGLFGTTEFFFWDLLHSNYNENNFYGFHPEFAPILEITCRTIKNAGDYILNRDFAENFGKEDGVFFYEE